jgi:hypothetical protein
LELSDLQAPSEDNKTPAAWVATMAQQDEAQPTFDDFFLSREKVIWNWPYLEDCIFEELA